MSRCLELEVRRSVALANLRHQPPRPITRPIFNAPKAGGSGLRSSRHLARASDRARYRAPPRRIQIVARGMNTVIARAPFAWPLLQGTMRRIFDRLAPTWEARSSVEHLTPPPPSSTSAPPPSGPGLGHRSGRRGAADRARVPQARVRGVDLSEEMIRLAQRRIGLDPEGRVAFRVADAADLPYEDDSFDLVAQLNMPPLRRDGPGGCVRAATS